MPRKKRSYTRTTEVRDANLYVISTEGGVTEPAYFEELISKDWYPNSRVHVKCLPTKNGLSSPSAVLKRLDTFKKEFQIKQDDELWVVIDRDYQSWNVKELSEVKQKCKQKSFSIALSNPSFEFWLILHCPNVELEDKKVLQEYHVNKKDKTKNGITYCESVLSEKLGSYSKTKPNFKEILPNVKLAIERGKVITPEGKVNLFDNLGTDVYVLVEKLLY